MSDFTLKEDWFHSDLLKIFALNILKNSQGVEIRGINMEQYSCQRQCQRQNCGREIFTFQPIILLSCGHAFHLHCANFTMVPEMCPKCSVQTEIRVDEIEITRKHKKKTIQFKDSQKFKKLVNELLNEDVQDTAQSLFESNTRFTTADLNELNNRISFAKKRHNESIHEVLIRYYDLGEALSKEYIRFFNLSHDDNTSKHQVIKEFKRQLNIDTLDMAHSKEVINWIRSFSLSSISSLSWDNIGIVKKYIIDKRNQRNRRQHNFASIDDPPPIQESSTSSTRTLNGKRDY
ncbi:16588_t:CDS:2, partial [Gigaspora margarita]